MTRRQRLTRTARESLAQVQKAVENTAPYLEQARQTVSDTARGGLGQARRALESAEPYVDEAKQAAADRAPSLVKAHVVAKASNARLAEATTALEGARAETAEGLAALGELELQLYDGLLRRFSDAFAKIKNVDLADLDVEDLPATVEDHATDPIKVDVKALDGLKAAAFSGGSGAAASLITLASVGTFATASTGTAIGSLSGAAATNATLAWLGGGSLASGGLGIAGGTMVLGGLVAAPVLAVGGLMLRHQGRRALATVRADALTAEQAIAEMGVAKAATEGITQRAEQVIDTLQRLAGLTRDRTAVLEWVVEDHDDYRGFSERERRLVAAAVALVKTVRAVIDVPVIDASGNVTAASRQLLDDSAEMVRRHEAAA